MYVPRPNRRIRHFYESLFILLRYSRCFALVLPDVCKRALSPGYRHSGDEQPCVSWVTFFELVSKPDSVLDNAMPPEPKSLCGHAQSFPCGAHSHHLLFLHDFNIPVWNGSSCFCRGRPGKPHSPAQTCPGMAKIGRRHVPHGEDPVPRGLSGYPCDPPDEK